MRSLQTSTGHKLLLARHAVALLKLKSGLDRDAVDNQLALQDVLFLPSQAFASKLFIIMRVHSQRIRCTRERLRDTWRSCCAVPYSTAADSDSCHAGGGTQCELDFEDACCGLTNMVWQERKRRSLDAVLASLAVQAAGDGHDAARGQLQILTPQDLQRQASVRQHHEARRAQV